MDAISTALSACLPCIGQRRGVYLRADDDDSDIEATADAFVQELLAAEKPGVELDRRLEDVVGVASWNWEESLAEAILNRLAGAIKAGAEMSTAAAEALAKVTVEAIEWSKEHPVYTVLIALGVLVILSPWILEALGFAEMGSLPESFAAWWQSTYAGYVPEGSLFSFFQRLGMVWRRFPKTG